MPTRGQEGTSNHLLCRKERLAYRGLGWTGHRRGGRGVQGFIKSFQQPDGNFVDRWLLNSIGWSSRIVLAKHGRLREMFADFRD